MNNMKKELEELEEGAEVNIHMDLPRATLKKMPSHVRIHGF